MPKLRRKQTSTKKENGAEKLIRNCRISLTRMSLKDIAAELNNGKRNLDCQISEDEINQFLASQSAIAVNKVPIYRRKVILAEKPVPRNDVYQFNFDAASELQSAKGKKTRKNTRKVKAGGIHKRKAVKTKKIDVLDKQFASEAEPKVIVHNDASVRRTRASSTQLRHPEISIVQPEPTTKAPTPMTEGKRVSKVVTQAVNAGSVRRTRASSTQLRHPDISIRQSLTKAPTPLNKGYVENVPNESAGFVELEITDSNITDRRLEKVRRFGQSTSTPIIQRKSVPNPFNTTNVPEKSPWRIQEGTRCPKTFYFSCSNDLMPSYASDVILIEANKKTNPLQKSTVQEPPPTAVSNVCESFETNNSNAENICPYVEPNKRVNILSNVVLKPAANRSPLKQMEIIGLQEEEEEPGTTSRVSTLATHSLTASKVNRIRKFATKTTDSHQSLPLPPLPRSDVQHEKSSSSECAMQSSDESTIHRDESNSIEDAFGFYTTGNFDEEFVSTDDEQHNYSKNVLKQRLKSLKKLAPRESTKTTRLPCQNQLFRSPRRRAKPTNIREMFEKQLQPEKCSTPQRSAQAENESLTLDEIELTADDAAASMRLFNDPMVPVVSVIGHPQRRSYSRILARKRKKVVGFVAVSDDSDSDTEAAPVRTKKLVRTKKPVNVEETTEFKAFVVAMNKEFAEVDKYELVIN